MALDLPDVTLVALDCVAHGLTRLAIEDTRAHIEPYEIMVWTDRQDAVPLGGVKIDAQLDSLEAVARCLWYEVPRFVDTSHFLLVQWDGWVIDADRWTDDWLQYDYIGAPWWFEHDRNGNVGNGGFSLRSTDMMNFIASRPDTFRVANPEDAALCRTYRSLLEVYAFQWAPEAAARAFSFERVAPPPEGTFGFHGLWNFPSILDHDRLQQRISMTNDYVRRKSEWHELQLILTQMEQKSSL